MSVREEKCRYVLERCFLRRLSLSTKGIGTVFSCEPKYASEEVFYFNFKLGVHRNSSPYFLDKLCAFSIGNYYPIHFPYRLPSRLHNVLIGSLEIMQLRVHHRYGLVLICLISGAMHECWPTSKRPFLSKVIWFLATHCQIVASI